LHLFKGGIVFAGHASVKSAEGFLLQLSGTTTNSLSQRSPKFFLPIQLFQAAFLLLPPPRLPSNLDGSKSIALLSSLLQRRLPFKFDVVGEIIALYNVR
jgi:hypothetical protein